MIPKTKKKTTKVRRLARRRVYRRKAINKSRNVPDYAGLSVKRTLQTAGGGNFNVNQLYSLMNTQLVDYPRAVQVAQAYQHYRIKKIAVTFKPTFDTFMNNGALTQSKMNMYWMIDKAGALPANISLEGLKFAGARPFTLDEKPHTITWSPSVLDSALYAPAGPVAGQQSAKYSISPWLSTVNNPIQNGPFVASGIDHLGLYWYCEQLLTPGVTPYEVEVEVQFQFKKPNSFLSTGSVSAVPAVVAELNTSSDGIVGGPDGV